MFKIPYMKEMLIAGITMNVLMLLMGLALESTDTIVLAVCSGAMCGLGLKLEKMHSDE